jgi:glycosyltransferase 2 family protein
MAETRRSSVRGIVSAAAKIALGAALLALLWHRGLLDPVRLSQALSRHPDLCLAAFCLQGIDLACMGLRWRILSRPCGILLGRWESIRLTLVSLAFSTCLPGNAAGDVAKGWILTRRGIGFPRTLGTMALDRWTGITGLFLSWTFWTAVLVAQDPRVRGFGLLLLAVSASVALGCVAVCLFGPSFSRFLPEAPEGTGWTARTLGAVRTVLATAAESGADRRAIVLGMLLSFFIQQLMVLIGWCGAHVVDVPVHPWEIGALLPATMVANSLPLSPGGVGIGETVGALGFSRLGYPASTGSETLLLVRLASVSWAIPGMAAWLAGRAKAGPD